MLREGELARTRFCDLPPLCMVMIRMERRLNAGRDSEEWV